MSSIRLTWPTAFGTEDEYFIRALGESPEAFVARAQKWAEALLAAHPPTGCVRMRWCSSGVPHDEQLCPDPGESSGAFIARVSAWIKALLLDFPPTNDCTPPFP